MNTQDFNNRARTYGIAIGTVVVAVLVVATMARCSGEKAAHVADRRAAVAQVIEQNTAALTTADTVSRAKHAGVAVADTIANRAAARANVAQGKYLTTRTAYSVARARVDSAPSDTAVLAAAVHAADTTIANADTTIAKKDSALTARTAERDSLVGDTTAIARQRDLYHERADTLQHALEQSDPGGCAKLCTIGKVALYTVAGAIIYDVGRELLRALFVGPAKFAR